MAVINYMVTYFSKNMIMACFFPYYMMCIIEIQGYLPIYMLPYLQIFQNYLFGK